MAFKRLIGGCIAAALAAILLVPYPAGASTRHGVLVKGQRQLEVSIDARKVQLAALVQTVNGAAATTLLPAHELVLAARLTALQATIASLANKVAADTSLASLALDREAFAKDDRPDNVIASEVQLTIVADGALATASALQPKIDQLVTALAVHLNQPAFRATNVEVQMLARMIVSVTNLIESASTSVLSVVPQASGASGRIFTKAQNQLTRAQNQLATLKSDISAVAQFLASHGD